MIIKSEQYFINFLYKVIFRIYDVFFFKRIYLYVNIEM